MKVSIGNDHAGTDYKYAIIELLESIHGKLFFILNAKRLHSI